MSNFADLPTMLAFHSCYVSFKQLQEIKSTFGSLQNALQSSPSDWQNRELLTDKQVNDLLSDHNKQLVNEAMLWAEQDNQAWLIEPVAGMIDLGESPKEACIREVKEETGADITDPEFISQFYPSPGACDEILHLYASEVECKKVNTHAGLATENEDIRVVILSFEDAKKQLLEGRFNVATTYMALQWLFFQKLNSL